MSTPSPEVYEQGKGMDAHNKAMREFRSRNDASYDPASPPASGWTRDNTPDGVYQSLTIIPQHRRLPLARAGGCTMCGYVAESVEGGSVAHEDLMAQVQHCLDHEGARTPTNRRASSRYTPPGLPRRAQEVPAETRKAIAETFADRDRIVVESLPDFVSEEKVSDFVDNGLETDVAVGLETATDRVRQTASTSTSSSRDFEGRGPRPPSALAAGSRPTSS